MFKSFPAKTFSHKSKAVLESLPFHELGEACKGHDVATINGAVDEFAEAHGIKHKGWVYPQIIARVGKWTPVRKGDLFSPAQTVVKNCKDSPLDMGIYYFCMSNSRYVAKQASAEGRDYCALVPLILSGFKKMQDIKYMEWDKEEIHYIVNSNLAQAMMTIPYSYSEEQLLQFRVTGLTVKSGTKAGTVRPAAATYGLNGLPWAVEDGEFEIDGPGKLPQLNRMMICQTWCAHPNHRSKYMILDSKDWDNMPKPLVSSDPMKEEPQVSIKSIADLWG